MRLPLFIAPLLLGLFAGCATDAPSGTRAAPAASAATTKASLLAEQRRVEALFRGTAAAVVAQADGSLRVEVPLRLSFDSGSAAVKPTLATVLDRLASSQRTGATRLVVTAPTDPAAKALLLATERAVATRDYLVERGVDATRFSISAVARGSVVKIVVANPAAPASRVGGTAPPARIAG
jgi:outer membrane protein OmpA-like peptidoglycan-associated protein